MATLRLMLGFLCCLVAFVPASAGDKKDATSPFVDLKYRSIGPAVGKELQRLLTQWVSLAGAIGDLNIQARELNLPYIVLPASTGKL